MDHAQRRRTHSQRIEIDSDYFHKLLTLQVRSHFKTCRALSARKSQPHRGQQQGFETPCSRCPCSSCEQFTRSAQTGEDRGGAIADGVFLISSLRPKPPCALAVLPPARRVSQLPVEFVFRSHQHCCIAIATGGGLGLADSPRSYARAKSLHLDSRCRLEIRIAEIQADVGLACYTPRSCAAMRQHAGQTSVRHLHVHARFFSSRPHPTCAPQRPRYGVTTPQTVCLSHQDRKRPN